MDTDKIPERRQYTEFCETCERRVGIVPAKDESDGRRSVVVESEEGKRRVYDNDLSSLPLTCRDINSQIRPQCSASELLNSIS